MESVLAFPGQEKECMSSNLGALLQGARPLFLRKILVGNGDKTPFSSLCSSEMRQKHRTDTLPFLTGVDFSLWFIHDPERNSEQFSISDFYIHDTPSAESSQCYHPAFLQSTPTRETQLPKVPNYPGSDHLHLSAVPWSPTAPPILLLVLQNLGNTSAPSLYDCGS